MKTPLYLFLSVTILIAEGSAQSGINRTCGPKDLKCQMDVLMKAMQADPKNPETYYSVGLIFQQGGNHAQAVELFTMYVGIPGVKPGALADGYNNRGISQRYLKKFDAAYADYTKAIELDPRNPKARVNRANLSSQMGKPELALADYDKAAVLDPKSGLVFANRAHLHAAAGKFDDAIKDLNRAIELDANNPEPYYTRAIVYRAKKDFARVITDLDKYIALDPGDARYLADGHLNRGIAYIMTGKQELAEKDLTRAIELAPTHVDAYRTRAIFYRELKKNTLAEADERKAAELAGAEVASSAPSANKTSFEYMAEGGKYYAAGDYKGAIPLYEKALELEKKERKLDRKLWIVLVDNLGMAYGISGDIKSSFAVFEYGISKEPTYPLFYYNMACGYGEIGNEANAIKYLRLAFKHRSNMLDGQSLPDPEQDSSFAKFRSSGTFNKAVSEMKAGK